MKPTESVPNHLTHTPVLTELVPLHLVPLTLSMSPTIKIVMESLLLPKPSKEDQSQLPLMPKTGHLIPVESTPTVEHLLITESYSLDIHQAIG